MARTSASLLVRQAVHYLIYLDTLEIVSYRTFSCLIPRSMLAHFLQSICLLIALTKRDSYLLEREQSEWSAHLLNVLSKQATTSTRLVGRKIESFKTPATSSHPRDPAKRFHLLLNSKIRMSTGCPEPSIGLGCQAWLDSITSLPLCISTPRG